MVDLYVRFLTRRRRTPSWKMKDVRGSRRLRMATRKPWRSSPGLMEVTLKDTQRVTTCWACRLFLRGRELLQRQDGTGRGGAEGKGPAGRVAGRTGRRSGSLRHAAGTDSAQRQAQRSTSHATLPRRSTATTPITLTSACMSWHISRICISSSSLRLLS